MAATTPPAPHYGRCERRQVGERRRRLGMLLGPKDDGEALIQCVGIESPVRVVAPERAGQLFAVGVGEPQRGRLAMVRVLR